MHHPPASMLRADRRISARSSGIGALRRPRRRLLRAAGSRRLLRAVRRAASRSRAAATWRRGCVANFERAAVLLPAWRIELDFEHAVAESRVCRVCVGALRQRYRPVEAPVASLAAVVAALLARLVLPALALDNYLVLLDAYMDVVALHAGQIRLDQHLAVALAHFDTGRPHRCACRAVTACVPRTTLQRFARKEASTHAEVLEQPVHLVGNAAHHRERPAAVTRRGARVRRDRRRAAARAHRAARLLTPALPGGGSGRRRATRSAGALLRRARL